MVLNVLQSISAPVGRFHLAKNNSNFPTFSNENGKYFKVEVICNLKCVEDGNEEPQGGGNGWSVKYRN